MIQLNIDSNNTGRVVFEFRTEERNGIFVITVQGAINAYHSPSLRAVINKTYLNRQGQMVVVDLTQVDYMDSSGIATLIEGVQLADHHQGKFILVGLVSKKIQHLLEITHLHNLFEQYNTVQDVFEQYSKPAS